MGTTWDFSPQMSPTWNITATLPAGQQDEGGRPSQQDEGGRASRLPAGANAGHPRKSTTPQRSSGQQDADRRRAVSEDMIYLLRLQRYEFPTIKTSVKRNFFHDGRGDPLYICLYCYIDPFSENFIFFIFPVTPFPVPRIPTVLSNFSIFGQIRFYGLNRNTIFAI